MSSNGKLNDAGVYPGFTYRMLREDLIISNGTHPSQPSLTPSQPTPSPAKQYTHKRYPINIPVPNGMSLVNSNSKVKVGTKVGACYAGSWESVTAVEINDDGTITCNRDNWKSFTYKMMREDLIIDKR